MKFIFTLVGLLVCAHAALAINADQPFCKAELNDELNNPLAKLEWQENLFMGSMRTPSQTILITTSAGNEKIMSLWVREKKDKPNGMFSFVDLSSKREQYLRFYMSDGYSVGVTCRWDSEP